MPVDTSATVNGFALKSQDGKFEPYSYHPRILLDDEVEVSITHCGICGSDLHTAFGGWGHVDYPIIVGHEIVGTITQKGKSVTQFNIGDRVGCGAQCGCCATSDPSKKSKCRGCSTGNENHCTQGNIGTYNGKYLDGERSQGGYADKKRFPAHFAFKIPDNIPSAEAAPLLCAGATTYSPLKRYGAGPGKKVGVIGIGGLGHLAVQWAAKMGAEVIAFGQSKAKAELSKKLGAKEYVVLSDEAAMKQHAQSCDIIICAGNGKDMPWDKYIQLGALDCHFVLVAAPEDTLQLHPFALLMSRVSVVGSAIGSPEEIREMLAFASEKGVRPMVEVLPMSEVNEGIRKVKENDVKFRVVLEQGK